MVFGPTYPSADHRLRLELELRYLLLEHGTIFPEGANSAVTMVEVPAFRLFTKSYIARQITPSVEPIALSVARVSTWETST